MSKTRHIQQRMSQRGINMKIVELVEKYGVRQKDKVILNRKGCQELSKKLEEMTRLCNKIAEKGGYVLVSEDGTLITVYRLDSYNPNLRLAS